MGAGGFYAADVLFFEKDRRPPAVLGAMPLRPLLRNETSVALRERFGPLDAMVFELFRFCLTPAAL